MEPSEQLARCSQMYQQVCSQKLFWLKPQKLEATATWRQFSLCATRCPIFISSDCSMVNLKSLL